MPRGKDKRWSSQYEYNITQVTFSPFEYHFFITKFYIG